MNRERSDSRPAPQGAGSRVPQFGLPGHVYDLIVCAGLAGVGVWFFVSTLSIEGGASLIDTRTVPMIAGGLLVVLCVVQAVLSLRTRSDLPEVQVARPLQVLIAMALILIFPPAIDWFGYYLTAVLWVPAFAWVAGARHWMTHLIVVAAVLALARFVFEMILGTPLP